jgi:hypothetical protein
MLTRLEASGFLIQVPSRLSYVLTEELENELQQSVSSMLNIEVSLLQLYCVHRFRLLMHIMHLD